MKEPVLHDLLRCPESHERLLPVTGKWVQRLNKQIAAGELQTQKGEHVTSPVDDGLITADDRYLYPVRNGLVNMFIADRIVLKK